MNISGTGFDDMLDDLDGIEPSNPHKALAKEAAKITLYKRTCPKCNGSGRYNAPSSLGHNRCCKCNDQGYFETKVSPEQFEARKARRDARKLRQEEQRAADKAELARQWRAVHTAESDWLDANFKTSDFALSLANALLKWGSLTDGQINAIRNSMAREAERFEARKVIEQRKEAVDITPVIEAFNRAGNLLKAPKLLTEQFRFSRAPDTGKNPGAIYVKGRNTDDGEGAYLGKIFGGLFTPSRECTPELQANLMNVCQDPLGAVVRYGRLTGRCGICSRKLDNKESIERGIGPICAEKFGF